MPRRGRARWRVRPGMWRGRRRVCMVARMRACFLTEIAVVVVGFVVTCCAAGARAQTRPSLELGPPAPHELMRREGASAPASTQPDPNDPPRVEASLVEFLSTRFRAHE